MLYCNVEPAKDWTKTSKGWGRVEKEVEIKLASLQYIKNNLQQLKEIAVFIVWIIVVPANCGNEESQKQM